MKQTLLDEKEISSLLPYGESFLFVHQVLEMPSSRSIITSTTYMIVYITCILMIPALFHLASYTLIYRTLHFSLIFVRQIFLLNFFCICFKKDIKRSDDLDPPLHSKSNCACGVFEFYS